MASAARIAFFNHRTIFLSHSSISSPSSHRPKPTTRQLRFPTPHTNPSFPLFAARPRKNNDAMPPKSPRQRQRKKNSPPLQQQESPPHDHGDISCTDVKREIEQGSNVESGEIHQDGQSQSPSDEIIGSGISNVCTSLIPEKELLTDTATAEQDETDSDVDGMGSTLRPEFEAAETGTAENQVHITTDLTVPNDAGTESIQKLTEVSKASTYGEISSYRDQIDSFLQSLEPELTSALFSVWNSHCSNHSDKKQGDAFDSQETRMVKSGNVQYAREKMAVFLANMKLRTIAAKMAMENQMDNAQLNLLRLRTVHIQFPSFYASEVVLVGSFDGWSHKRQMQKSTEDLFTITLMLYPGRYEIKFIADGEWTVDPLLPIVKSSGYKNNVLKVD